MRDAYRSVLIAAALLTGLSAAPAAWADGEQGYGYASHAYERQASGQDGSSEQNWSSDRVDAAAAEDDGVIDGLADLSFLDGGVGPVAVGYDGGYGHVYVYGGGSAGASASASASASAMVSASISLSGRFGGRGGGHGCGCGCK